MQRAENSKRALRMLNLDEFLRKKFDSVVFSGVWRDLIGNPALCGIWVMWGNSSNGKTTGAMKLAQYITRFEKCIYWSKEENASKVLQDAFDRVDMQLQERRKIFIPDRYETLDGIKEKLRKPKSPNVIFFDSLQIFERRYGSQFFFDLKEEFSETKLLVFVSQAEGKNPKGKLGDDARYDADVKMRVEGHRIFSESRIKGAKRGSYVTTCEELANEYWGNQ
jgi:hypothetical protein